MLGDGRVQFTLSDGSELEGRLHEAWRQPTGRKLLVTALDLKNAYKQFALSPSSRAFAVLLLREPKTSRVSGFESAALPFGSTASVCHFNRLARLFRAIGCRLHLMWFNYFDDYPVISPEVLAPSSEVTMQALAQLLGFVCSWDKYSPFAVRATMLGVEVDLSAVEEEGVKVRNKEGRASSVAATIYEHVKEGSIAARDLLVLLGRIQFADAQIMGRSGRLALTEIRRWSKGHVRQVTVSRLVASSFNLLARRLEAGEPRCIPCAQIFSPVVIFTDGASEGSGHTIV